MAEDYQFKEQKIVLVKPIKKITEDKKVNDKNNVNAKNEKTTIPPEDSEDFKPEEGVLTFYVELDDDE